MKSPNPIDGGEPQTRSAIARALQLTPARVRRIEADALERLRVAMDDPRPAQGA